MRARAAAARGRGEGSGLLGDEEAEAEMSAVAQGDGARDWLREFYPESISITACLSPAIAMIAISPEFEPPCLMSR